MFGTLVQNFKHPIFLKKTQTMKMHKKTNIQEFPKNGDLVQDFSEEEQIELGFYDVEAILKHKYHQGWRFLTKWEGFPIESATWEPVKSFTLDNGRVNQKWLQYCQEKGLYGIIKKAQGQ
jgi:hypothetical protein